MVSYVHAGIFVPVFNPVPGGERFAFSPLGNPATKLAYWDEEAYVSELMLTAVEPEKGPTNENGTSSADKAAAAAEKEGLVKPGKESEAKAKKRKAEASAAATKKKVSCPDQPYLLHALTISVGAYTSSILEQSTC